MKYVAVFERTPNNYSAYVPDLPGCVATGNTRGDVERAIRDAVLLHLDGMREDKQPIPEPGVWTEMVEAP
jgi:predicted RNase H-like HicB family nuclease